jgi:hypothetical protein
MIKSMSKNFKIFLIIIAMSLAVMGAVQAWGYFSYARLINVARTLPGYHGIDLSGGTRGERECYSIDDSSLCKALIIEMKEPHDTNIETKNFISNSQNKGIKWPAFKDGDISIDSDVFARDGRNYQIYILHEKNGATSISLLEY